MKARVSCFVFQIFRACGALGLRRRLRRTLRDQYLLGSSQPLKPHYHHCTYSTVQNVVTASAELASPLPLPLACTTFQR